MAQDRYGTPLTSASASTEALYNRALDELLAAAPGFVDAWSAVVEADPGCAMGHMGLARAKMVTGDIASAKQIIRTAQALSKSASPLEAEQIELMAALIQTGGQAYSAIRAHVADHPRHVLLAQTCTSIYGLIGLSGKPGREAETLAYISALLPHYGDDWWATSMYAFALCEVGCVDEADTVIERSLSAYPRNAHGAHVRSHIYYEAKEIGAGITYLSDWLQDYSKEGMMYGHLSWHTALWQMVEGDWDSAWARFHEGIDPSVYVGPLISLMADSASFLFRAELLGQKIEPQLWKTVSDYAMAACPQPGLNFIDLHAALAHAMAGCAEGLELRIEAPVGPAKDLVSAYATAFKAMAQEDWTGAANHLSAAFSDHARIGGSRAQRDLLELALFTCLQRAGFEDEAHRTLQARRPVLAEMLSKH